MFNDDDNSFWSSDKIKRERDAWHWTPPDLRPPSVTSQNPPAYSASTPTPSRSSDDLAFANVPSKTTSAQQTANKASGMMSKVTGLGESFSGMAGGAIGSLVMGVPQAIASGIAAKQRLDFDKQKWDTLQSQSKSMGFASPAQMFTTGSFGKQTTNKPVYASTIGTMDNDTLGAKIS